MSVSQTNFSEKVERRVREAEEYLRHGLYEEAHQLFKDILSEEAATLSSEEKIFLDGKIEEVGQALERLEATDPQALTSKALNQIRGTWSAKGSAAEILESGGAFVELGMHKEAIREYIKLLDTDTPIPEATGYLAGSFFSIHKPERVLEALEKSIEKSAIRSSRRAELYFEFGLEAEKRELKETAGDFWEAVGKINADYPGLGEKLQDVQAEHNYDSRYGYLLESGAVNEEQLQNALGLSKRGGKSVEAVLIETFGVPREEVSESLVRYYKVPFQSFDENLDGPYELTQKLKKPFLIQNCWVPLEWDLDGVEVLIDDPKDLIKTDQIATLLKAASLRFRVGIREDIVAQIESFFSDRSVVLDDDDEAGNEFDLLPDIEFEEDDEIEIVEDVNESSSQIVRMVDQVLVNAYRKGASDVHIEPSPVTKKTSIRYRIDGVCQEMLQVPNQNARGIVSRLKVMAKLDIAERRLPQDGKIKFKRKGIRPFELRLATLPTTGGFEDAVLRILAESGAMKLDDMGMRNRNLEELKAASKQPYGLILVVGPTGSGKTTTLHAALHHINKPGIKIWTAEDPVEITQAGLRQVECNAKIGLNFARVMRAFLRADPDVIMIGEMRDHETASIGIEASLTGHLVLSTLHTNSAPETITRLLDMGLNPLNFSDAFLCVLAQRLVRRVCPRCAESYALSEADFDEIASLYGAEAFQEAGYAWSPELKLKRPVGCPECNGTGYRGRMGIHEMLVGSPDIKRMIKREASTEELFRQGASEGMTSLLQDGIMKVFEGLTDIDEIRRVCVS